MTLHHSTRHLALLAFGYGLSIVAASGLLGSYRSYAGQPALERILVLFMFPLTATVIWALVHSLQRRRLPDQENGLADGAIRDILFWVVLFLIGIHTLLVGVLFSVTWIEPWAQRGVVVLAGVALIAVGNILPRTRPNIALGMRTTRTLTDRQLWMLTHRTMGYAAVMVGVVTIVAGLFLSKTQVAAVPGTTFLFALAAVLLVYWKSSTTTNPQA